MYGDACLNPSLGSWGRRLQFFVLFLETKVSLQSHDCPRTLYVDQPGLKATQICLCFASWVLGLKMWETFLLATRVQFWSTLGCIVKPSPTKQTWSWVCNHLQAEVFRIVICLRNVQCCAAFLSVDELLLSSWLFALRSLHVQEAVRALATLLHKLPVLRRFASALGCL